MVEDTFKISIKKYGLLKKKDKVILGISGGPDSICMLYQFLNIREEYKLYLVCAHFNHGLRKESDAEEEFVKRLCGKLKIKLISEKKSVGNFFCGDSLEQTARNLRFDFFLKCFRQLKIKNIALAHHKDDLAETVLMRLIRGAGLKGLRGFLPKSKFKKLTVVRPLIDLSKQEIINWVKNKKVKYCIDQSNFEQKFFRNHTRITLLPLLKKLNPNIINTLSSLSRNLALDYDFISLYAREQFFLIKERETARKIYLNLRKLQILHRAVFNNVIRFAVCELKGNTRNFDSRHLGELYDLIFNRPVGSVVDLPEFTAKKEEKTLLIQSLIL